MSGAGFFVGMHFVNIRNGSVFFLPTGGRTVQILLKLSVKAGKTPVSDLLRNEVNRLLIQVKQMAGLLNTIVLEVFQRTDSHNRFKNSPKMAFTDAAEGGKRLYGYILPVMFINIRKRLSDITDCALRLFYGRVAGMDGDSVQFSGQKRQKPGHSVLIEGLFFVEFLKNL